MSVILLTWELEIRSIDVQAQPTHKIARPHLNAQPGGDGVHSPSQLCERHKQEDRSLGQSGQKWRPSLKKSKAKRDGGVDTVVECLPSNLKALSSDSSTTINKTKQKHKPEIQLCRAEAGRSSRPALSKSRRPYLKNKLNTSAGGVAHMLEDPKFKTSLLQRKRKEKMPMCTRMPQ
jgi:hypothetical protein